MQVALTAAARREFPRVHTATEQPTVLILAAGRPAHWHWRRSMLTVQKYACVACAALLFLYVLVRETRLPSHIIEHGPPGPPGIPGGFTFARCPVCESADAEMLQKLQAEMRILQEQVTRLQSKVGLAEENENATEVLLPPPPNKENAAVHSSAPLPSAHQTGRQTVFRRQCSTEPPFSGSRSAVVHSKTRPYTMSLHTIPDVVSESIENDGTWEPQTVELLTEITNACSRSELVIDVGGNIGWYTSWLASMGHRVISVEPFGLNMPLLMSTVCRNGMENLVDAFKVALLDEGDEDMCLMSSNKKINNGNAMLVPAWEGRKDFRGERNQVCQERIRSMTLDHLLFLDPEGAHLSERPLAMKMDIEGSETKALRGAKRLLAEYPPCFIFFEHQPLATRKTGAGEVEIFQMLEDAGYQINELQWNSTDVHRVAGPRWGVDLNNVRDLRADLVLPGTGCGLGRQRCRLAPGS